MKTWILPIALAIPLLGCGGPETQPSPTTPGPVVAEEDGREAEEASPPPAQPPETPVEPTDDDLRAFLAPAFEPGSAGRDLALALRPTAADCDAVFQPAAAQTVRDAVIPLFDSPEAQVSPGSAARTVILVRSATTEELAAESEAAAGLPGGMTMIAAQLLPGIRWYHVKFVQPGRTTGQSLAAFVYVSGRWVWFPKPWRYLR